MPSEAAELLEKVVRASLPHDRRPTEDEVRERMEQMRLAVGVSDDEFDEVRRRLHAKLAISMDLGVGLVSKDHVPWLAQRRAEINPYFWERYRQLLQQQGRPPDVINAVDSVGDTILDFCWQPGVRLIVDPQGPRRWRCPIWQDRHVHRPDLQSGRCGLSTRSSS